MKMIVGLGNPGNNYHGNRHNLGFMAIDHFALRHHLSDFREQKQALILKTRLTLQETEKSPEILLVKPLTYVNLSGNAVQQLMLFYKISILDLLVVSEDIHLPFGALKIKAHGGTGGHNGLRSIHRHLGEGYPRLRFGVGYDKRIPLEQYVLSDFPPSQKKDIYVYLDILSEAILDFTLGLSWDKLMDKYNGMQGVGAESIP